MVTRSGLPVNQQPLTERRKPLPEQIPFFLSPVIPGILVSTVSEPDVRRQMHYNAPVRVEYIAYIAREETKVYLDSHVAREHYTAEFLWRPCIRFHLNDSQASDVFWCYETIEERDKRFNTVLLQLNCQPPPPLEV